MDAQPADPTTLPTAPPPAPPGEPAPHTPPLPLSWTAWGLLLLFSMLTVWGVNVGLRLVELPLWQECGYCQVDGQWLMATHDAYYWLAGAEEVARSADRAMPRLVRFVHAVTGIGFPTLGFWLPVLLAPLAVLPLCLLAFRWNLPAAALLFGILAAACFGYPCTGLFSSPCNWGELW